MASNTHDITKMSPMEYARARKMQPQLVYYYIRTGKIDQGDCICGRRVIDVAEADAFFEAKGKKS